MLLTFSFYLSFITATADFESNDLVLTSFDKNTVKRILSFHWVSAEKILLNPKRIELQRWAWSRFKAFLIPFQINMFLLMQFCTKLSVGVKLTLGKIFPVKIGYNLAPHFWQKALHHVLHVWKPSIWLNYILALRLRYLCLKFQCNRCIIKGVIGKKPSAINYVRGVTTT